jgi:hypothetical protein
LNYQWVFMTYDRQIIRDIIFWYKSDIRID